MTATNGTGIWGNNSHGQPVVIPVIGITGKYQSGKTLFGLSIAPGGNRTRCYDLELSASGYRGLEFDYLDTNAQMRSLFGTKPYLPIDLFRWWYKSVQAIEPGKFAVIMCDPITDIESGLVDYVAADYASHGFSSEKAFVSTGGIFWSKVREFWKRVLADIASRCETFVFTAHLRKDWIGGKPTRNDKPGGKSSLLELASLYLWLDRSPDEKGVVPSQPRCLKKLKDRLSYTSFDPATMEPVVQPYLPPAFDDCTPGKIREYLKKPADYKKLKPAERVQEAKVTEIERLEIEKDIAEARASAEDSALQRLQRQLELRQLDNQNAAAKPHPIDVSSQVQATEAAKVEQEGNAEPAPESGNGNGSTCEMQSGKCSVDQSSRILHLKGLLAIPLDRFNAGIARYTGGSENPLDLTPEQASDIIAKLEASLARTATAKN